MMAHACVLVATWEAEPVQITELKGFGLQYAHTKFSNIMSWSHKETSHPAGEKVLEKVLWLIHDNLNALFFKNLLV